MRLRAAVVLALAYALAAPGARAYVPPAEKVADAVAEVNRAARRTQPLRLQVKLEDSLGELHGEGEMQLAPGGELRLELRTASGDLEVHRWVNGEERVRVNGHPAALERPLLAPLGLLQAGEGDELLAELRALGGVPERVELGLEGPYDCYVLGGRRAPPGSSRPPVALWVDLESFEPVRIDRADGVRFRLGRPRLFGSLRFPDAIEVEAAGRPLWRLRIENVSPTAPAAPSGARRPRATAP